ncbi:MAG: glutamylcysteine synthetase [Lachnospiraceae bacterium]|nr:glutamylcysteine synthetase [Lachnospiraceae bacterium]
MIDILTVRQALIHKYIEPTKKTRSNFIGVEIELPIVNLDRKAVDFEQIQRITAEFMDYFQFAAMGRDDTGFVYAAQNEETGDILSYDCSYNNIEFSFGKEKDLNRIQDRFSAYYRFMENKFSEIHYVMTGMGVNPYRAYNNNVPIENGRYRMLFHHLGTYEAYRNLPMYFHSYPTYGTFSSASQVQLDVSYEKLIQTIQTFNKLEPITGLLFSNSVFPEESEELLCVRDLFWENSTHGINPHNIGMFDCQLETIDDLLAYIESCSMYCVERGDKYINFSPIPVADYFSADEIKGEYYQDGCYHTIAFQPDLSDLAYLRTFKFEDLTFRGTIEHRSCCTQPISDVMTVAAYHLGLNMELEALTQLLDTDSVLYHHGYTASELRKLLIRRNLPAFIDEDQLYKLTEQVLALAESGLKKRGLNEEQFLAPLFQRAADRSNPAKHALSRLNAGDSIESVITEYSKLMV